MSVVHTIHQKPVVHREVYQSDLIQGPEWSVVGDRRDKRVLQELSGRGAMVRVLCETLGQEIVEVFRPATHTYTRHSFLSSWYQISYHTQRIGTLMCVCVCVCVCVCARPGCADHLWGNSKEGGSERVILSRTLIGDISW